MKTVSINFMHYDAICDQIIHNIASILDARKIKLQLTDMELLRKSNLKHYIVPDDEYINNADLAVAIGGDGTFLNTARKFLKKQCPIFGINRGKLGFLTEFNPEEYEKYFVKILNGDYKIKTRSVLMAENISDENCNSTNFINDAVISKGAFSRIVEIEIFIDDLFFNRFRGDGLIISTPTGSTAYSLSAGGPIVTPSETDVIILNPVCPHSMSMRPAIIPGSSIIKARIISEVENLLLTIDGQESIRFKSGDEILFKNADKKMNLIVHPEKNFYSILREKLHWGKF